MKAIKWVMAFVSMGVLGGGIGFAQTSENFSSSELNFARLSKVSTKVEGKLTNNSGADFALADFLIHVHDKSGKELGYAPFTIGNFLNNTTREFISTVQANAKDIATYKIEFRQKEVGQVKTSGDFTPQNVDFIKTSRTYAKAKGEIINRSNKNLRQAEFQIQVYDKSGKLIGSSAFSIRNFMAGSSREFQATLEANVREIETYKIELKEAHEIPPAPTTY